MSGDVDSAAEVLRGLAIFGVSEDGDNLAVSIYGSDKCVCGSVTFTFPDRADRRQRMNLIRSWAKSGAPITYIASGGQVTLVDERDARAREWLGTQID